MLYPKGDDFLNEALTIDLADSQPMKVTVTGLAAGSWLVHNQSTSLHVTVTPEGHLAHMEGLSGRFEMKPTGDTRPRK